MHDPDYRPRPLRLRLPRWRPYARHSLHHDVLGASRNGVDSIFICGGVHYMELGVPQAQGVAPSVEKLGALLDSFAAETDGCTPTHTLAGFRL